MATPWITFRRTFAIRFGQRLASDLIWDRCSNSFCHIRCGLLLLFTFCPLRNLETSISQFWRMHDSCIANQFKCNLKLDQIGVCVCVRRRDHKERSKVHTDEIDGECQWNRMRGTEWDTLISSCYFHFFNRKFAWYAYVSRNKPNEAFKDRKQSEFVLLRRREKFRIKDHLTCDVTPCDDDGNEIKIFSII